MVFKYMTFLVNDNYLNTRPGSPPAPPSPAASPRGFSGCAGLSSMFDELRLRDPSRDGGAVWMKQDENAGGRNGSAGKANPGFGKLLVLKVDIHDNKGKSKVMQVVSGFGGIGSLNMDTKDNKLTVSGEFDPIKVVNKLRKSWHTDIVSVGPAKEDEGKKDKGKKDEDQVANLVKAYQAYYSRPLTYQYVPYEETPNCVI